MIGLEGLQEQWQNMQVRCGGYRLLDKCHPLDIRIGYGSNEHRSMIVRIPRGTLGGGLPSTAAIRTDLHRPAGNEDCEVLEFLLTEDRCAEEFEHLCWDLVVSTAAAADPAAAIRARYDVWINLLRHRSDGTFSAQRQMGLLGELLYFSEQLELMPPAELTGAWRGPEGADQDFVFADRWAEIKAVTGGAEEVGISSPEQLGRPEPGCLVVYFLEHAPGLRGPLTLPEIVEEVQGRLQAQEDALPAEKFRHGLFMYGYDFGQEDSYAERRYRLLERRTYAVAGDFPRLTRGGVPPAVARCRYSLRLAALTEYLI